jgi:polysaccharide export outer membrane protein
MKQLIALFLIASAIISLPSCKVLYPNEMYRLKDYEFFSLAQRQIDQYIIQSGDELTVQIYSRDGFALIDIIGGAGGKAGNSTYLVDKEGFARIPVLGDFYVKGYTESELERVLAEKFAGLFVDPYVILKVVNRRVILFRGSTASVVSLNRTPTSLFEVLATAGGLSANLKAYKIKIIRGDLKNPEVHLVDLSTLESVRKTDLILQGNDIIYIQERRNYINDVLGVIFPYVTSLTSIATLITLAISFKNFGK